MAEYTMQVEPGKQEIIVTSMLNARRELVFKACTTPEHIPHWWGPAYLTTTVERMEAKPGGSWRFVQRDADGNEYAFRGVYHDVVEPERIVYTFEWEGMPGHVLLETLTFEEVDGRTRMVDQLVYQSVADRDGMVQTGMEGGTSESLNRLEALAAQAVAG